VGDGQVEADVSVLAIVAASVRTRPVVPAALDGTPPGSSLRRPRWWSRAPRRWDLALAAAAVLTRLPLIAAPARPDEAGYLMVAAAAHPHGPYLYGDLWVDRPPLLIAFFALAHALGGLVALRLLVLVPVVVLVLAAAGAGRALVGQRGGRARRSWGPPRSTVRCSPRPW
jgi:hypothetical protein